MRMPRRPRRSSIKYIENNNSRSISFSKRRDGLFKMATNLSTLTGARIAIVLEAENGKMSGFSAPSFGPIMDSFLSGEEGGAPEGPDEQEKDMIAKLQKEIMQLEESKVMREQRAVESLARVKEIQERSRMGKLIYSKVDDLCVDELNELLRGLARIGQEIRALLAPPPWVEIGGSSRGPPPLRLFSPPHSQVQEPPRRLPWVSSQSQPSLSSLRSSCTLPQSIRPQVSVMSPPVQPSSLQAISRMLLRHTQLSQRPASLMVRPQAPVMMPLPNEAHQYNYQSLGVDITGNTSGHFSQTSMLSSLPPPPPPPPPPPLPTSALQIPSQRSVEVEIPFEALNLNPDVPSQNHANPHSILENNDEVSHFFGGIGGTTPTHSFTGNEQPSLIPCGANGGHHAPGCHNVPCPSGSNGETYEWLSKTLLESSSEGGSSSDDDGAGDSLGNMDWFGDDN